MRFAKFILKTLVGTVVMATIGSFTFITILEKSLSSEAKKAVGDSSKNIMHLLTQNTNSNKDKSNLSSEELSSVKDVEENNEESEINKESKYNKESKDQIEVPENILTNKNDNFIFIGDSRTVAYKDIVDIAKYDFVTFISEESKGYDWLNETVIEKLDSRFNTTDLSYNVVINLGINDLHNINNYVKVYNELASKNPKHNFFVVSLNKVDSKKMVERGYNCIENSTIEEFNSKIKNSLSENIHFIDTYSYFRDKDLETTDGLHYTSSSSNDILNYISNYIKDL